MTSSKQDFGDTIEEQAGYWVLTQSTESWTPAQEKRLQHWLSQSHENRCEYERALKLWHYIDNFTTVSFPARDTAQAQRKKQIKKRERTKKALHAALGSTFAIIIALGVDHYFSTTYYSTQKGEQQVITLADGSEITLNTQTALTVKITPYQRTVYFEKGEAFFQVVHDQSRPFHVIAANGHIQDIGTRFDVYRNQSSTQVTVLEGEVGITNSPPDWNASLMQSLLYLPPIPLNFSDDLGVHLTAGQHVSYNDAGQISSPSKINVRQITAWREGRLEFASETLQEVMAQVSRYHPVEFEFESETLKQVKVSASFESKNLNVIVNSFQATFPIKIYWIDEEKMRIVARK
mgnify:CR=1 FL=1